VKKTKTMFVCPRSREPLEAVWDHAGKSWTALEGASGTRYPVTDGVPELVFPERLDARDAETKSFYDGRAEAYDRYLHLTFRTHGEDERAVREGFAERLQLRPDSRVLDLACGTGRDAEVIAGRLGPGGVLAMQDLSRPMLDRCRERTAGADVRKHYCVGNALHLPFADGFFDAAFSFGGLGEFSDIRRALAEMVRVTKVGGKIVVGDESIPPWLRGTDFAKILMTTNAQFRARPPLREMPVAAREVRLEWVIGGVFYLVDFRVGEGEPTADFDFEIPGPRGGTYRTRYEGQLEGVTPEAKALALEAVKKKGVSMHRWLDEVVRAAARRDLGGEG
jgi:ubiquinone/menaquinone biosynthesis C-methylase UbiE